MGCCSQIRYDKLPQGAHATQQQSEASFIRVCSTIPGMFFHVWAVSRALLISEPLDQPTDTGLSLDSPSLYIFQARAVRTFFPHLPLYPLPGCFNAACSPCLSTGINTFYTLCSARDLTARCHHRPEIPADPRLQLICCRSASRTSPSLSPAMRNACGLMQPGCWQQFELRNDEEGRASARRETNMATAALPRRQRPRPAHAQRALSLLPSARWRSAAALKPGPFPAAEDYGTQRTPRGSAGNASRRRLRSGDGEWRLAARAGSGGARAAMRGARSGAALLTWGGGSRSGPLPLPALLPPVPRRGERRRRAVVGPLARREPAGSPSAGLCSALRTGQAGGSQPLRGARSESGRRGHKAACRGGG